MGIALAKPPTQFQACRALRHAKLTLYPLGVQRWQTQPPQFVSLWFIQVSRTCLSLTLSRFKLSTLGGNVILLAQVAVDQGLKPQSVISSHHSSGGWKIKVLAEVSFWWGPSFWLAWPSYSTPHGFPHRVHLCKGKSKQAVCSLLYFCFKHCSPQWLHQFTFPPTMQKGLLFFIPPRAFIV